MEEPTVCDRRFAGLAHSRQYPTAESTDGESAAAVLSPRRRRAVQEHASRQRTRSGGRIQGTRAASRDHSTPGSRPRRSSAPVTTPCCVRAGAGGGGPPGELWHSACSFVGASSPASAAPRMPVGFHDDATFRWSVGAGAALDRAGAAHASVIRTIADWRAIAPIEPRSATDSFDPAYRFGNLDDLVRNAQRSGLQVMITIWGTPRWANDGHGPNVAPTSPDDLADFGRAVADRYSGRYAGLPHVGRYSIWNEPNLEIFLTPQFDRRERSSAPGPTPRSTARAMPASRQGNRNGSRGDRRDVESGTRSAGARERPRTRWLRAPLRACSPGSGT